MIPLMEDHGGGGGVHGDPRWLMDYYIRGSNRRGKSGGLA